MDLTSDPENCGACGYRCPQPGSSYPTCQGGVCGLVCDPDYTLCNNACVYLPGDPQNCGACGHACAPGQTCCGGVCGYVECGNTCVSESAGGDVNPNGYSCGTASSGHCYGETIGIGGLDPNPKVYGYSSKISIPTRIQSGDNFITNEFWLSSASGPGWIEAGLISLRVYGDYYFWAMTDQTTGIHTFHPLGPIAQGDANVTVSIYNTGPNRATSPDFFVDLTTDHMVWHIPVTNAMWSVADQFNQYGRVHMGQELAGTGGVAATLVLFTENSWLDEQGNWDFVTNDGDLSSQNPPFAGWCHAPSSGGLGNGGIFFTECCLPIALNPRGRLMNNKTREALADANQILDQKLYQPGLHQTRGTSGIPGVPANALRTLKPDDIFQFIRTHPVPKSVSAPTNVNMTRMDCNLTASDVANIIGQKTGLAEDRALCYAEIEGPITFVGPPRKAHQGGALLDFGKGFYVFDAETGNLVLAGAYAHTAKLVGP